MRYLEPTQEVLGRTLVFMPQTLLALLEQEELHQERLLETTL